MAYYTVIRKLAYEARKWENRVYADNGIDEFKDECIHFIDRHYGVKVTKNI